jgi:hypothetical protein
VRAAGLTLFWGAVSFFDLLYIVIYSLQESSVLAIFLELLGISALFKGRATLKPR